MKEIKIAHVRTRFLIGNNQERLEMELIKLTSNGYEIQNIVNNAFAFSFIGSLFSLFVPLRIYTIIAEKN